MIERHAWRRATTVLTWVAHRRVSSCFVAGREGALSVSSAARGRETLLGAYTASQTQQRRACLLSSASWEAAGGMPACDSWQGSAAKSRGQRHGTGGVLEQ
jgi:hypothetical protein